MTEAEWLGADSPLGMLGWLCEGRHSLHQGPVSDRKLRLFACACCRAAWHLLTDERSRRAVEEAERLADRREPGGDAARAWAAAQHGALSGLAWQCTWPGAEECAWNAVHRLRSDGRVPRVDTAALLREVVGNPFRPAALDPAMPNWCEIAGLAEAAYDERLPGGALDPARLAVLADALEDAACESGAVMGHLRSPGLHYRGCWPLDLVLGVW